MGIVSNIRAELELSATELLEEYSGRLMAEAMRLCRDESAAEDLVMRTFERYFSRRPSYDPQRGSLLAWLRSVMRNLHTDSLRKRRVEEVLMSPDEIERVVDGQNAAVPDEDPEQKAREERLIVEAVDSLSPKLRAAVVLHYFECLPLMEVARSLCISENSVKQRLYYARKVLANRLAKALGRTTLAIAALIFGGTLLYAAAVATGLAPSPFVAAEPAAEDVVVFNTKSTEDTESSLEVFEGLDEECLSLGADPTNHESRTTNHETNGDSPQGFEAITANSETNNEETTMNTQMVKSVAVKAMAAGAMLAASAALTKSAQADGIPDGYTEVEYIQGNGSNARIVTDYIPKPNLDKIEAVVEFPSSTLGANQVIWCARYGAQDTTWTLFVRNDSKYRFDYGSPSSLSDTLSPALTEGVKYTVTAEGNEFRSFDANGQTHSFSPAEVADFTAGGPLELFVSYNNGNPNNNLSSYGKHRLYSFKVWRSGKLLHYFVPCIRTSDSKAMLVDVYDNTTQLTVAGTFSAGEAGHYYDDALVSNAKKGRWPNNYTEVEYIQGNGTDARFITDYTPTPNADKIEAVIEFPSETLGANQVVWCARYNAQNTTWTLFVRDDSQYRFDYGSPSAVSATLSPALVEGVKYTVTAEGNEFRSSGTNGQTHATSPDKVADFTAGGPLVLFSAYDKGLPSYTPTSWGKFRLYSFKVWYSGKLVHYFVPCIKASNGKATMVDICDDPATLTREGTFTAGPEGHYYDDMLFRPAGTVYYIL